MVTLERSLSLWEVTLMSIGIILGAGIYVVIGEAAGLSGNSIWLSFIIAATVAAITGLSYAELSSRFPYAGAEYVYVTNSLGPTLAWLTGWIIIAGSVIGGATVAMGFSRYFTALFNTPILPIALLILGICGIVLIAGVKETASLTILFTVVEIIGLIIIIVIGIPSIGKVNYLEMANGIKGVIEAGVLIFFGYLGFEGITRLAEETKNPEKNIPKAIFISLIITTIIYIFVGISAISVVSSAELANAKAPLALVAERIFGDRSFLILSSIALFSTFNTALVMLLSGSRLVYGMAKQNALPSLFQKVSKKLFTPWPAILVVIFASMIFIFIDDLKTIANLTNFTIFLLFILVNTSLIYFRFKKPTDSGFKIPGNVGRFPIIPGIGIFTACFMLANLNIDVLILGSILIIVGLFIGVAWQKYHN
jgi:APA family basic amino acid/polyamine antiporter